MPKRGGKKRAARFNKDKAQEGVVFYGISLQRYDWEFITNLLSLHNQEYSIKLELEIKNQMRDGTSYTTC